MKYTKLLSMMFLTLFSLPVQCSYHTPQSLDKAIESWLHAHFAVSLYSDLSYSENLFMNLKQHLISNHHAIHMRHQDLKNKVKNNITALKHKKYHTRYWFQKHKKELTRAIQDYLAQNKQGDPWGIYRYLNTSQQPICFNLQETMKRADILPAYLNELIRSLIKNIKGI